MCPDDVEHSFMSVWCTLIPFDELQKFVGYEEDLEKINEAYDDWRATMRSKPFVGTNLGMLLDRIRMLMIDVGIACGPKRDLASSVQTIVSKRLKQQALRLASKLSGYSVIEKTSKAALKHFFSGLKFTRDIVPMEEMKKAVSEEEIARTGLLHSTNIIKKLYMQLLSPDPWGTD